MVSGFGLLAITLLGFADAASGQAPPPPAAAPGVPVTVAVAVRQDVPILLRNIGTVQALQTALIRTRVDGTIDKVLFDEGQEVKRGDKLVVIDPRPYQAALDQAMAKKEQDQVSLANAQRDLARYQSLAQREFASRQQVDTQTSLVGTLTATLHGDDATIAAAKVNVDYTNIVAPFDGVMGLRQIDAGNVVRAADNNGIGIVTISQIHPITVLFPAAQDALPAIRASIARGKLPVTAYNSDNTTLLDTGELLTFDNAIDPTTGMIRLKAVFPNAHNALWPGQFVNVRLQTDVKKGVLTVPSIAVQRGMGRLFVYAAKPDGTVAVTPVTIAQDDGQNVIIASGLDDGAQVVVNGQSRLQNGSKVIASLAKPNS
jgi:multidrug efflux system membrane fusion protein